MPATSLIPASPGQGATERHDHQYHALRAHAGVAGGAGVVANHADLVAQAGAAQDDPEDDCRDSPKREPEMNASSPIVGSQAASGKGCVPGNPNACGSRHGPWTRYCVKRMAT